MILFIFVSKNSLKMLFKNYWPLFFFYFIMCFQVVFFRFKRENVVQCRKWLSAWHITCQRPYHVEHTSSRPITEVKQHWARIVLRWETAWELLVLLAFFAFSVSFYMILYFVSKNCLEMIFLIIDHYFYLISQCVFK